LGDGLKEGCKLDKIKKLKISGRKSLETQLKKEIKIEEPFEEKAELTVTKKEKPIVIEKVEEPKRKAEKPIRVDYPEEDKKVEAVVEKVKEEPSNLVVTKTEKKKDIPVVSKDVDVSNMKVIEVYDLSSLKDLIRPSLFKSLNNMKVKDALNLLTTYKSLIEKKVPGFDPEDYRRK